MRDKYINIIMPAYNESKNIAFVIKGIRKELPGARIIIIDDSDKKENINTISAIKSFNKIRIISRRMKKGRGSAVVEGFKEGLKHRESLLFFEMDSDFAHESTHLIRFLEKIKNENLDMIIGSRYIKGGSEGEISVLRRILSRIINKFLAIMLEIKLTDYTSGYRLYSRKAVKFITASKLKSSGFITLSEITYKLYKNGFKIGEVPVTITKRKYGNSSIGIRELIISLIFIFRLKLESN